MDNHVALDVLRCRDVFILGERIKQIGIPGKNLPPCSLREIVKGIPVICDIQVGIVHSVQSVSNCRKPARRFIDPKRVGAGREVVEFVYGNSKSQGLETITGIADNKRCHESKVRNPGPCPIIRIIIAKVFRIYFGVEQ
ncbi:hypothetical protein SDC9_170880 [bioreactor metagenome]|uniref:Uncharacterized protein n=1 Tax=bioreactor metagenome TaxID=1076179 RepID=A0A645GBY1_9ZZZZ